jgi:hypothetical protein
MTQESDSFQADGRAEGVLYGFLTAGQNISIGGRFVGQTVGAEAVCNSEGNGLHGQSAGSNSSGVWGENTNGGYGVSGSTRSFFDPAGGTAGVWGNNDISGPGVKGTARDGDGVLGISGANDHAGVSAVNQNGYGVWAAGKTAGHFQGDVEIVPNPGISNGNLSVQGIIKSGGSFRIDHPLDPENKYLYHSFVESPDMKNIYDGVVILGANGEAVVELPEWFESLNKDFRYQLTAMGAAAPDLHVAEEVNRNRLKIAGGNAGMKVSWSVTGIRQDAWANEHRIPVEEEKPFKSARPLPTAGDRAELLAKRISALVTA